MIAKSSIPFAAALLLAGTSLAATYDEGVNGDLSNDRFVPTPFTLDAPSNLLSGSVTIGERDYFTMTVPTGSALSQIILRQYDSNNARAFIGLQQGLALTLPPDAQSPSGLLGYMHFGFEQPLNGDLLDDLATSLPPGFSTPLPPGNYTFWVNQTEPAPTAYAFDFVTVPEPASVGLLALLSLPALHRRPVTPNPLHHRG